MADTAAVVISSRRMTLDEVVAVARGAQVQLGDDALARITEARAVVDDAIARGDAIYGVTTGVGHARDERLPDEALRAMQPMLLDMHVGGVGEALSPERVRAALVTRLNGFARGGAGVSLAVAHGIAALLNHGIHPVIPSEGSLGAGDLGQLALVGRVLLGRGEVEVGGERMDAASAMTRAGLDAVSLEPKDALAILSSNAVSIGHGALLSLHLRWLLELADTVAATSMEAMRANPSILDAAVAAARNSPGQQATSEAMRHALAGSRRTSPDAGLSVQDPLSFRVVPQVHGACRDVMRTADEWLTDELNAASDNPLVDIDSGRVISNGNFHAMNVALAGESLRVALAHVGLLSERRMGHLWDAAIGSMGTAGPAAQNVAPTALAGLGLRYPAAARYTLLRQLAQPMTLDVGVLDFGVEDHAPNTAVALQATEQASGIVEELLVTETLISIVLLGGGDARSELGNGTGAHVSLVDAVVDRVPPSSLPHEVHGRVLDALRTA